MSRIIAGFAFMSLALACARPPEPALEPTPAAPATSTAPATSAPSASSTFDPIGSYSMTADAQGTTYTGTFEIQRGAQGGLVGSMNLEGGNIPLQGVSVTGSTLRFSIVMPDGPEIAVQLQFEGDAYRGTWSTDGASGPVHGARRR